MIYRTSYGNFLRRGNWTVALCPDSGRVLIHLLLARRLLVYPFSKERVGKVVLFLVGEC